MLLFPLYPTPESYPLTRAQDNAKAISFGFEFGMIVKLTHLMPVLIDRVPFHWIIEAHSGMCCAQRDCCVSNKRRNGPDEPLWLIRLAGRFIPPVRALSTISESILFCDWRNVSWSYRRI